MRIFINRKSRDLSVVKAIPGIIQYKATEALSQMSQRSYQVLLDTGLHASDLGSLKLGNADMNMVNMEIKHGV
jgi:hypothetical protein